MGNSKKGTAVEEKVVFTGNQQDFEKFRTWFHNEMDEKDRQKYYNPNADRPSQILG